MKDKDFLYTNRVYSTIVEDFLTGEPDALAGAADFLQHDKGYSKERLVDFFCDTLPLVRRRIKKNAAKKSGRIITLTSKIVIN